MKFRWLQAVLFGCFICGPGAQAHAQGQGPGGGHPPGGPPGGGMGPGGPPPPPGSTGPAGPPPNGGGGNMPRPTAMPNVATRNGIKLGPPGRWWDDRSVAQTVGLSRDQQKKMDTIFNANKPAIIQTYQAFEKEQTNLAALSKAPNVDQSKMFAAIDAVNQARAALEKANTQMLLQIRQQLEPDQLFKLDKLP